jgi:PIN domain nuclease of toxin-antitoxin system
MNLLLDTHAVIWFLEDDAKLSARARVAISDSANRSYVSDASLWELCIKASIGRIQMPVPARELFPTRLTQLGFHILPIRHNHFYRLLELAWHHRDPFDRLLIAQAESEAMTLISCDPHFPAYGVSVIW